MSKNKPIPLSLTGEFKSKEQIYMAHPVLYQEDLKSLYAAPNISLPGNTPITPFFPHTPTTTKEFLKTPTTLKFLQEKKFPTHTVACKFPAPNYSPPPIPEVEHICEALGRLNDREFSEIL